MVARSSGQWQTSDWRRELRASVWTLPELCRTLDLDPALALSGAEAARAFPPRVPPLWLAAMARGNPDDPLLRQILPSAAESLGQSGFGPDPVGDRAALRRPGLLQKYAGRALILTTGSCPIHCRYCFRRWFPFAHSLNRHEPVHRLLAAIAGNQDLTEIILSGGDPLLLNDRRLATLLAGLDAIGHLRRIRLHTRVPVVLPSRIEPDLCRLLSQGRLRRVIVVQVNHPRELSEPVAEALGRLRAHGLLLLNQSVLLRGVNDNAETLVDLSEGLFNLGVLPYYLHRLDPVAGAAHFDLPLATVRALIARLRERLPGYLVPRVVADLPGAGSKSPVEGMQDDDRYL